MSSYIFFSEKNVRGAWVIYGAIGVRQYYGYTKAEAEELYLQECKRKIFYEKRVYQDD